MAEADYRLLTEATGQRIAQAVENLINPGESEVIAYPDSVRYGYAQTLTDTQKQQAQQNIGVTSSIIVEQITTPASIMSFPDGAAVNAHDLVVEIEPVQSGSGDPSPENVRPISGWTGANVTRTGKNLLPKGSNKTGNGITFSVDDSGAVNVTGTANTTAFRGVQFTIPAGTYTLNGIPSGTTGVTLDIRDAVGGSGIPGIGADSGNGTTFTIGSSLTAYVNLRIQSGYVSPSGGLLVKPMIRLVSDADPTFAPYTGTTIPITFPSSAGTVYGGTLDVTTGLLTVTMAEVDLGTLTWNASSRYGMYSEDSNLRDYIKKPSSNAEKANAITSFKQVIDWATFFNPGTPTANTCSVNTSGSFGVSTTETDPAAFKQSVSGQQLVYELATPQTYQLTPTQVTLLLGKNNIWADTGDVQSVEYQADTKLYIDKKIAELA